MKNKFFRRTVLLLLVLFAAAAAGCAPRYARTADGKTLWRIGFSEKPATIHPYAANSKAADKLFSLLYDPLFCYDEQTESYVPALCESYTIAPTDDGAQRWDLVLRADVSWHDGTRLTADDVAFSLQSQSDFSVSHSTEDCSCLNAVGIDVSDETHLAFVAFEEEADVLRALSRIPVLPKAVWNAPEYMSYDYRGLAANYKIAYEQFYLLETDAQRMLGSGPYQFVSLSGDTCTLKRNDAYWGEQGRTEVTELLFGLPDPEDALQTGKIEEIG